MLDWYFGAFEQALAKLWRLKGPLNLAAHILDVLFVLEFALNPEKVFKQTLLLVIKAKHFRVLCFELVALLLVVESGAAALIRGD